MKYYSQHRDCERRLIAVSDGRAFDLTSATDGLRSYGDLLRAADRACGDPEDIATKHRPEADSVDPSVLESDSGFPFEPAEVWAAGVTYQISEAAREAESDMPEIYLDVYDAERPEIFFKATPGRTVGPGEAVGIRGDSDWNVPEPELGIVLYRGDIVGYTIGNDVSSRDIEGQNPLYLPQAKVYDRCCALGPCVVSADEIGDPHDLEMTMTITRNDDVVYEESTSTSEMATTCEKLVSYLCRHNAVPETGVLLTGTALVPEDGFTLSVEDTVSIDIEGIGTLENPVTEV